MQVVHARSGFIFRVHFKFILGYHSFLPPLSVSLSLWKRIRSIIRSISMFITFDGQFSIEFDRLQLVKQKPWLLEIPLNILVLLLLRVHRMCHRYQPSYLLFIVWIIHANRMTVTYVYLCMNVNRIPNRILNIHNFFFLLRLHTTRKRHRILWKWHIGTDRKRNGTNKRVKRKRRMEKTRQNVKMHNNKE